MVAETEYFVEPVTGIYLGGFCGTAALALVPEGSIQVSTAPDAAWWLWDFENEVWIQEPPV